MKDLFVCSGGIDRSPTAVSIAYELARECELKEYCADSFGVHALEADESMSPETLASYDRYFVMDDLVRDSLHNHYGISSERMILLDIPDTFSLYEKPVREMLKRTLREKLTPYFQNPLINRQSSPQ